MKSKIIFSIIILLLSILSFGQSSTDIQPYSNGHLNKKYNPAQIDFSAEYLQIKKKSYDKFQNLIEESIKYDCSSIWISNNWPQNGVLGTENQRIQFYFETVTKSNNNPFIYFVSGKAKVNNNICNFKGEIKIQAIFIFNICDYSGYKNCGSVLANYIIYEDSTQTNSGVFKGVTESLIYLDKTTKTVKLDESFSVADGYWNRSFIGIWTDYKNHKTKKCIWGDYRLPFTFDFDCGDGEMHVCEKYVKYGWQTFGDGSELIAVGNDKFEIKNKWWLNTK